jgi:hypothetical protein
MAKINKEAAIEQLKNQAQELQDIVTECDNALDEKTLFINAAREDDEEIEYFVPREYILAAIHSWRENTCLRLLAVNQKLGELV